MKFTENEIDLLRWLIKSEISVQTMLLDHSDGELYLELNNLYDKVCSQLPKQSLGST